MDTNEWTEAATAEGQKELGPVGHLSATIGQSLSIEEGTPTSAEFAFSQGLQPTGTSL